ncbi:hypothetical protein P3T76_013188 [Phytophthora citrophthora]|uniref:Uncharacterized protein n=1 Tax=Phytophthora citrophthora TaxID=4793 RepID=A0AAD9LDA6_9STRA|nr:hypothetical protein P3T76_013188 [Phytophthora citrophthora]
MFIRIAVLGEDHVAEMEFQERDTMRNVVERGIQKLNTSDFSLVGLIVVLQPVQTLYIGDKAFQDMQKGIISDNTPGFSLDNTMESWSTNMTQTGPGLQHDPKRIDFVFDVPQRTANNSRFLYAMERRNAGKRNFLYLSSPSLSLTC